MYVLIQPERHVELISMFGVFAFRKVCDVVSSPFHLIHVHLFLRTKLLLLLVLGLVLIVITTGSQMAKNFH